MIFKRKNSRAITPPMGWNSWDNYAAAVNEDQLLQNAKALSQMKEYGWEYVVCDIQWSGIHAGENHRISVNFAELALDEFGRQIPAVNRFPSSANGTGFRWISDQIHQMGLKFGVHLMRGVPRQAVHQRCPIYGTDETADQIADFASICNWSGDMYGVKPGTAGQAYYDSVFQLFAEWGVDFVKVDDICHKHLYLDRPYGEDEVEMIAKAIDRSGREMVLSLSPGPAVIEKAWHMEKYANMWRITDDFWDKWDLLKAMFERCEVWQRHVYPGSWPDCDMLPVGFIGKGFFEERKTRFTSEEQRTMMTLWGVFRSPLMIGADLTKLDEETRDLLCNQRILQANQKGKDPVQIERTPEKAVWTSKDEDGNRFLAVFNLSDNEQNLLIPWKDFEENYTSAEDCWSREILESPPESVSIRAHDCKFYYLKIKNGDIH